MLTTRFAAITSIDMEVGNTPVDPAYAKVTKHRKWAIPWMEVCFSAFVVVLFAVWLVVVLLSVPCCCCVVLRCCWCILSVGVVA